MSDPKNTYYFIVNPRAGSGKTMRKWLPAEKKLERDGIPFVTALTDHKRHATQLAMKAARKGYRKIVSVGGDGSLHETFNGICRWCEENGASLSDFCLAVIPIGSGNDWIKSLGVPCDAMKALELLCRGDTLQMDVIEAHCAEGRTAYMANVGGVGFDSHVCRRVNIEKESGRRSRLIYLNALVHTVFNTGALDLAVVADGKTVFSGKCYSIGFGNGKYSGSGMRQVPLAVPDDGYLDFLIVPKLPLAVLVKEVRRFFTGTMDKCPYTITGRCKCLQVVPLGMNSTDIVELDGEIIGRLPMSLEVTGEKIEVIRGPEL